MITKGGGGGRMMDGNWDLALFLCVFFVAVAFD